MSYAAEKARLQQAKSISWLEKKVDKVMGWAKAFRQPQLKVVMLFIQAASVYSSFKFGETYGGDNAEQVFFFSRLFCAFAILNLIIFSWLLSGIKDKVLFVLSLLLVMPLTVLDGVAVVGYSMSASPPDRLTRGYNEAKQLIRNVTFSDGMLLKAQKNAASQYPNSKIIGQDEALANQERANTALAIKRESLRKQGVLIIEPAEIMFYSLSEVVAIPALILKGWFAWLAGGMLPWVALIGGMYGVYYARLKVLARRIASIEYTELMAEKRKADEEKEDREFDEFEEEDDFEKLEPGFSHIKPLTLVVEDQDPDFTSADDEPTEAQLVYKEVKRRILQLEMPKPSIREIAGCRINDNVVGKKQAERLHRRLIKRKVLIKDGDAVNSKCIANKRHPHHKHYRADAA